MFERGNGSAKMDLDVVVIPRAESQMGDAGHTDDRILLLWEYNADLFEPETMRQMAAAYLRLLEEAVSSPDAALAELRLLTGREQERIVRTFTRSRNGRRSAGASGARRSRSDAPRRSRGGHRLPGSSATRSWTGAPTGWRAGCGREALERIALSGSACRGAPI